MIPVIKPKFPSHISAGFFTRQGGVSQGIYDSLNIGFSKGDEDDFVRENRRRACLTLEADPTKLVTLKQTHGTDIIEVEKPLTEKTEGDALVTSTPGLLLGIQTADCVPVLLASPDSHWVAAIHAGWKSAVAGIIEKTVALLEKKGVAPQNLVAAIGPCIWQDSYEVSQDLFDAFKETPQFFKPHPQKEDKWFFDLPGFVTLKLREANVSTIQASPADTVSNPDKFFSNRRHFLNKEDGYGSLLSAIMVKP